MTRRKPITEKRIFYNSHDLSQLLEETLGQFDFEQLHWLEEEEYAKAIGQLRMQIAGVFDFLKVDEKLPVRYMYGMGEFIPGAIEEIFKLAEDFGLRVRGLDKPISLELIRNGKRFVVFDKEKEKDE